MSETHNTLRNVVVEIAPRPAGSVSAEDWWVNHATLLAQKMKRGGVKEFRIFLNYRGNYEFEVVPTAETPTAGAMRPARKETTELKRNVVIPSE